MTVFFEAIKNEVGQFKTDIFMFDDASCYYNAWIAVIGEAKHRLLCKWHVNRNWKNNHLLIPDKQRKYEVYVTLRMLLEEPDQMEFSALLDLFLQKLKEEHYNEFFTYFNKTYAKRAEVWAVCYRAGTFINTNMCLEDFHRVLKYVYLSSRKNQRLDILIHSLFKIVRDKGFDRLIRLEEGHANHHINDINQRHRAAKHVTVIIQISDIEWHVTAFTTTNTFYSVTKEAVVCEKNCMLKCLLCHVCVHMFSCSCPDYFTGNNLCKHIHAVIFVGKPEQIEPTPTSKEEPKTQDSILNNIFNEENEVQIPSQQKTKHQSFIEKLKIFTSNG